MITQEIPIEDKLSLYITMEPDIFGMEEVVVIKPIRDMDACTLCGICETFCPSICITVGDDEMLPENLDSLNNIQAFLKRKKGSDNMVGSEKAA